MKPGAGRDRFPKDLYISIAAGLLSNVIILLPGGGHLELTPEERKHLRKQKRKVFVRTFMVLTLILGAFIGYNVYRTVDGLNDGGVKIDDRPVINGQRNTLSFGVELQNDGYLSMSLDVTVNFSDIRHNKHIGTAQQSFDLEPRSSLKRTVVLEIDEEFVNYSKSEDGLYIEIEPSVSGTYARFLPIPETELKSKDVVIKG